jgi:hypothetical protein
LVADEEPHNRCSYLTTGRNLPQVPSRHVGSRQQALFNDVHKRIVWTHFKSVLAVKFKVIGFLHSQTQSYSSDLSLLELREETDRNPNTRQGEVASLIRHGYARCKQTLTTVVAICLSSDGRNACSPTSSDFRYGTIEQNTSSLRHIILTARRVFVCGQQAPIEESHQISKRMSGLQDKKSGGWSQLVAPWSWH